MPHKYNVKKNWVEGFGLIRTRPIILLPFILIAFLEILALELLYFSFRKPFSFIAGPIIRKFFGRLFLHYPVNLTLLPKLFYYGQVLIYIFLGVFLTAVAVNMVRNIKAGLPLKTKAVVKNALGRYAAFVVFGITVIAIAVLVKNVDAFLFSKFMRLAAKSLSRPVLKLAPVAFVLLLFFSNVIIQTFLILAVPLMVIKKAPFLKAVTGGIYLGGRNFFRVFRLISVPFLLYLPEMFLKNINTKLMGAAFPEITLLVLGAGVIVALFVDCFIIVCASQFLLDIGEG